MFLGLSPNKVIAFFILPNASSRNLVLGLTQPVTQMSIRNLPGGEVRPVRSADNLTAINEPIFWKI
jgi:hypothetical protein